MFFALTDEQRALAATARDFLADRFGTEQVRAVYDDPDGDGDPASLWSSIAEQGWLAILVPEQHDGLGLGLLDAQVIARAFGAATTPGPWAATVLGAEAIRLAGDDAQQAAWLPRVAAGEAKLALATRAEGGSWSAAGACCTADGTSLTGQAAQVEYAHVADALVTATTDGGLWLVDASDPGVEVTRTPALDRTTRLARVSFTSAAAQRLGRGDATTLETLYRRAAVLTAADLVGIARAALTRTVAYDKDRVQFGRPVGSFQAIKHALADLHIAVTMAEHGVLYAAHALDADLPGAAMAASVAKAKASDAARDATAAMIQYHGGIGYTWEHDAHFYFKRAKREEYLFGDGAEHRERLAALLTA